MVKHTKTIRRQKACLTILWGWRLKVTGIVWMVKKYSPSVFLQQKYFNPLVPGVH